VTRVAVVGLGKIGLPLAALFASNGADVTGCDIDEGVVEAVNRGVSTVLGEPGLADMVASTHATGRLRATSNTSAAVAACDVVVVAVRAAIDAQRRPDFAALDRATTAIGRGLRPGTLVMLETTVPVGTTRGRFARLLSQASGLETNSFQVAYSPERVSSGSIFRDLATYPKLAGGLDTAAGEAAATFYRAQLPAPVTLLPDAETAEFTKLAESVYRDVNIALANELAMAAERLGVDYGVAAAAANSQPYSHLHAPGVGVGGHCIPVYPYLLLEAGQQPLVALARRTNDSMADYAAARLAAAFEDGIAGKTVLVLGLAYRGGVKEAGFSSTMLLAGELTRRGSTVLVNDPLFSDAEIRACDLEPSDLPPQAPIDAAILQAMHPQYEALDPVSLKGCRVFLDGRRAFDRARVEAAGQRYLAIGLP
jgi:nucleotide sugar dehydrogenase